MKNEKTIFSSMGVILASAMALFMVNLDATVVNIVLPELCRNFQIQPIESSMIILFYLLSLTGCSLIFGRLCDIKGPEKIFLSGYIAFGIGSGLCGAAWSLWSLVIFRFIQGIGGAMIFATSAVLIMRYIPSHLRGRAYAVNGMMAGAGFALGSPFGGFISHHLSWRAVFYINIPIALLGLLLCRRFLSFHHEKKEPKQFDFSGAITSFLGLALMVITLQGISANGLISAKTLIPGALSLCLLVSFFLIERKTDAPLLKLSLFSNRFLNFALAGTACYYALLQGVALLFPFYFMQARGLSEMQTGNLLFIGPIVTIIFSPIAGWLCDKVGAKTPCFAGSGIFVIVFYLFTLININTPQPYIIGILLLMGLAMSLYSAPILTLTMSHGEKETIGELSSVKSVFPSIIGMAGVAVFANVYELSIQGKTGALEQYAQSGFRNGCYLALGISIICLTFTILTRSRRE